MNGSLKVYIGWDSREPIAYAVARYSLFRRASAPVVVVPLVEGQLRQQGLFHRPVERREGQMWDVISDAPQSTAFATTRFLTPLLARSGWALFTDCDMLFTGDVVGLMSVADPQYAVMVVKHEQMPTESKKMDNQVQTVYARKNWSSVMLFNCDHPSNRENLTLDLINTVPGRDLHRFCWLNDEEIGTLEAGWNWLVDVESRPDPLHIAHYTLGGPWFPGWTERSSDAYWLTERDIMLADRGDVSHTS